MEKATHTNYVACLNANFCEAINRYFHANLPVVTTYNVVCDINFNNKNYKRRILPTLANEFMNEY